MYLSTSINNSRLTSDMPYKESLICNILYRNSMDTPERLLTATDLCSMTKMLKSQMNRTLNNMETQGLIRRERSGSDKRAVYVYLQVEAIPRYLREHTHVLNIVDAVCGALGKEDAKTLAALMQKAASVVSEIKEEL